MQATRSKLAPVGRRGAAERFSAPERPAVIDVNYSEDAEIMRLYHGEKWPIGTIAGQLGRKSSPEPVLTAR